MLTILYICTDWYERAGSTDSLINLIHSVEDKVYPIVLLSNDGAVKDEFDRLGIETIIHPFFYLWDRPKPLKTVIHHPTRSTLFHYLTDNKKCARYVYSRLKNRKIDIVHSNSSITTVGTNISRLSGAKHVWHIREFLDLDFGCDVYCGRGCLNKTINRSDVRICISQSVSSHWGLNKVGTFIIHDAVLPYPAKSVSNNRQKTIVFCAATISSYKGADTAVRSFCESGIARDGYTLEMIGLCSDVYRSELLKIAKTYSTDQNVRFVGYCSDVKDYFEHASAFLMCSEFEAFGRVTVQAMAYGCPVIARNSGGTTDFVKHNETGYLFETEEECTTLIQQVIYSDQSRIVNNAWKLVNEEFTEEVYGRRMMEVYNSLI